MELVLKQPVGKPPFIGILFKDQLVAEKTNKSPIENYFTDIYNIAFEPNNDKVNLTLSSNIHSYCYEGIKYDAQKLLKFLAVTRNNHLFNFSHIIDKQGQHTVVKSTINRRLWVLKVGTVEIIYEH